MLNPVAEDAFRRGRAALERERALEALALFEAAIEVERRNARNEIQARYLSFYGLCLALVSKRAREGVRFCRQAIAQESFDADLYCNLGRAYLAAGHRREAYQALRAGRAVERRHREIRRQLDAMGRRRKPALPFLKRDNPLNVLLGRI